MFRRPFSVVLFCCRVSRISRIHCLPFIALLPTYIVRHTEHGATVLHAHTPRQRVNNVIFFSFKRPVRSTQLSRALLPLVSRKCRPTDLGFRPPCTPHSAGRRRAFKCRTNKSLTTMLWFTACAGWRVVGWDFYRSLG